MRKEIIVMRNRKIMKDFHRIENMKNLTKTSVVIIEKKKIGIGKEMKEIIVMIKKMTTINVLIKEMTEISVMIKMIIMIGKKIKETTEIG